MHKTEVKDWYAIQVIRQAESKATTNADTCGRWNDEFASATISGHMLAVARSFARLQGVPANTEIRLAGPGDVGTACAGFKSQPFGFKLPYILVGNDCLRRTQPKDYFAVLIGLVLHESAHILFTRELYVRRWNRDHNFANASLLSVLENILEDDRIERRIADESPGWAKYLERTREVLLVEQWFSDAIANWGTLSTQTKKMTIVGCFVRRQRFLSENDLLATWVAPDDNEAFLNRLRKACPKMPQTEADVIKAAERLAKLMDFDPDASGPDETAAQAAKDGGVSGVPTLTSLIGCESKQSHIHDPFDEELARDVSRVADQDHDETKTTRYETVRHRGKHPFSNADDTSVIYEYAAPEANSERIYKYAAGMVRGQVARLRNSFPPEPRKSNKQGGRTVGSLDSRALWRAPFDDQLFYRRKDGRKSKRINLVLLLDASGSMNWCQRVDRARETAVLFNEALHDHPSVKLRVFSHTTKAKSKCRIIDHSNGPIDTRNAIGCYQAFDGNLDYLAINHLTKTLQREGPAASKNILIVVSDGKPCGIPGSDPVQATASSVRHARSSGWTVIGVGIGDESCAAIYDDRWSIRTEPGKLPSDMASLLVRLLRKAIA